ncbi:hypothetical protein [Haloferula sp.]|uniref:hypothetical protein n=1 Tax=Haloferula sp. TaxID=2497595 RepID=UPI003C79327B
MKNFRAPILFSIFAAATVITASSELPSVNDRHWIGTFAGFENRSLRFQFLPDGSAIIHPLFKDKETYPYVRIPISITLEESLVDGSTKLHPVLPESLESPDKPTVKLKETTVKGSFEGGGTFELTLAQKSGAVLLSGRLLDLGNLDSSSVRLRITAEMLNFYGKDERRLENDPKAFAEVVAESSLTYTTKDRKQTSLDFSQSINGPSTTVSGVMDASVELAAVGPKVFGFTASGLSSLRLEPRRNGPLHKGFFVIWSPGDSGKTGNEATFSIQVK